MFVEDIRNDFYNLLLGNRVLLLVHYDVDAICACKILQSLFHCDNIVYTLVPVGGVSELKIAYEENNEEIKYVVMINCGGTIDIVDILQPDEDVLFFVIDSHKPTDICNVFSDGQVRLVFKDSEENIPNFDDIFREDEDEQKENPTIENRQEALEAEATKRRERREWEERRNAIMFNYTQFSYYGKPSACILVDLAWRVSRCGVSALWCACVSSASHAALNLRASSQCLLDADTLHQHIARIQHSTTESQHNVWVTLEKDAWLPLYRGWSVESALKHAPTIGPHLKLHTLAGEARVRQILADMGFPLQQARQSYRSMDVDLRKELLTTLESAAQKHKLPAPTRATFLLKRTFSPTVGALDLVYILMALIEDEGASRGEGLQRALAALDVSDGKCEWLNCGSLAAQRCLSAVAALVHSTLASRQLHLAGPFTYFILQEGTPTVSYVRGPLWLGVAARWAAAASGTQRPLLASAPTESGKCILLGVPPRYADEPQNLFGAAFEQAATRCGCTVSLDHLDSSVVTLPTAQRTQFIDALTALLS